MLVLRSTFGAEEVVIAILLEQMWAFYNFDVSSTPQGSSGGRKELVLDGVILCQGNTVESMMAGAEVPGLLNKVLTSIIIVEQACVETRAIQLNRLLPMDINVISCDDVIDAIFKGTVDHFNVGIYQPELAIGVTEVGCPHASRGRDTSHVDLARPRQRGVEQRPVDEVL